MMENAAEAKAALKKALAFEHEQLGKEMKKSEDDIQATLDKWRMQNKELRTLEECIEFKEAVKTAKLILSGRQAATELLKYGYSLIAHHPSPVPRHLRHRPRRSALRASSWQHTRSLSLFGWGSSKSANPDFSNAHSPQPAGSPPQPVYEKWDATTAPSSPTPIKAMHVTSDTPATSPLPHTPEPQILRDIENAIAVPHPSHGAESLLPPEEALSTIPERIGYLKEVCGLDYGWGPAACLEFTVEHLHIYGGLTWAASIVGCAVLIRLLAFRPALQSSNISVRLKQANPILAPLREEYKAATLAKDTTKQTQVATHMRLLMKEYNISYSKLLLPALIQVPLSFGAFRLFRGMASLPVPAFETEEWLWTTNLTQSDPWVILPVISAASLYMSLRLGSETGTGPMQGNMAQIIKVLLPSTSLVFVYFQPGAVQLFFCTGSILSLCQTALLQNARVRRWLGVLPLVPRVAPGNVSVAGLNTWQDPSATFTPQSETAASKNVSIVDRYVDAAKGRYTNMKESVLGKTEDRLAARQKATFVSKAEKYEASRRQQAEWDRENRNKSRNTVVSNSKSGKDMIDELVEEDEDRSRTTTSRGRKRRSTGIRR